MSQASLKNFPLRFHNVHYNMMFTNSEQRLRVNTSPSKRLVNETGHRTSSRRRSYPMRCTVLDANVIISAVIQRQLKGALGEILIDLLDQNQIIKAKHGTFLRHFCVT
jgi:hypothetical protein